MLVGNVLIAVRDHRSRGLPAGRALTLGSRPRDVTRDVFVPRGESPLRESSADARYSTCCRRSSFWTTRPACAILRNDGPASEVNLHMVTAASSATQNVVTAANRAGLQVDNVVYEALMSADCILRADEKELGVCLADVGAGRPT